MLEEKNEPLEMRRLEFAVDAVKRVGHRMGDLLALQVLLQIENFSRSLTISRAALRRFPRPADLSCRDPAGNMS